MRRVPLIVSDALWALAFVVLLTVTVWAVIFVATGTRVLIETSVMTAFTFYAGWVMGYAMGSRTMGDPEADEMPGGFRG